jgi:hypothetical protein
MVYIWHIKEGINMNKTIRLLSDLAWRMQLRRDPAWREAERREQALYRAWSRRHSRNRGLLHAVNDRLDARGRWRSLKATAAFSWGCG